MTVGTFAFVLGICSILLFIVWIEFEFLNKPRRYRVLIGVFWFLISSVSIISFFSVMRLSEISVYRKYLLRLCENANKGNSAMVIEELQTLYQDLSKNKLRNWDAVIARRETMLMRKEYLHR